MGLLGQIWIRLRVLLKFAAYVAGYWAAFRFIFDFSNVQAVGLGLAIAGAIDVAASNKGPSSTPFRPHMFGIYPHIGLMLIDLGLVTDEEFNAAAKDVPPYRPWSNKHLLHYPIRAFFISFEPSAKTEAIHWSDLGYYSTRLEVEIKIEPFKRPGRGSGGVGSCDSPRARCQAEVTHGQELPVRELAGS